MTYLSESCMQDPETYLTDNPSSVPYILDLLTYYDLFSTKLKTSGLSFNDTVLSIRWFIETIIYGVIYKDIENIEMIIGGSYEIYATQNFESFDMASFDRAYSLIHTDIKPLQKKILNLLDILSVRFNINIADVDFVPGHWEIDKEVNKFKLIVYA